MRTRLQHGRYVSRLGLDALVLAPSRLLIVEEAHFGRLTELQDFAANARNRALTFALAALCTVVRDQLRHASIRLLVRLFHLEQKLRLTQPLDAWVAGRVLRAKHHGDTLPLLAVAVELGEASRLLVLRGVGRTLATLNGRSVRCRGCAVRVQLETLRGSRNDARAQHFGFFVRLQFHLFLPFIFRRKQLLELLVKRENLLERRLVETTGRHHVLLHLDEVIFLGCRCLCAQILLVSILVDSAEVIAYALLLRNLQRVIQHQRAVTARLLSDQR